MTMIRTDIMLWNRLVFIVRTGICIICMMLLASCSYSNKDGNVSNRMTADFDTAVVLENNGDYHEAMRRYLSIHEESGRIGDDRLRAEAAQRISGLFLKGGNYAEAKRYMLDAVYSYGRADLTQKQREAIRNLAVILMDQDKSDRSPVLPDDQDPDLQDLQDMMQGYADSICQEPNDEELWRMIFGQGRDSTYAADGSTALDMTDTLMYLGNASFYKTMNDAVNGTYSDFHINRSRERERKSRQLIIWLAIAVAVIPIVAFFVLKTYRRKAHRQRMELEANMSSFLDLKKHSDDLMTQNLKLSDTIEEQEQALKRLEQTVSDTTRNDSRNALILENLFREKWNTLNLLCNEYFEYGDTDRHRKQIINSIDKELKRLSSEKGKRQIEEAVDTYMGGIMGLLRKECPMLKEADFTFLSFVYAGMSVRTVCLFMDIKYQNYYVKKSRLTKRIMASDAPHKELFIAKLS